jgi:hypothetical protein
MHLSAWSGLAALAIVAGTPIGSLLAQTHPIDRSLSDTGAPCLFFPAERIADLRQRLRSDPELKARWTELIRRADQSLDAHLMTYQEADSGSGSNAYFPAASRSMAAMSFELGLAWRVTGEQKYAQRLRDVVLHAIEFDRWDSSARLQHEPPLHSNLWTATFTVGCSAGYEAVFEFLSDDERKKIAKAIARLGVEPIVRDWLDPLSRVHAIDSMGHNYFAICCAGAGVGALAIYDVEPRAAEWLDTIESALEQWFDYRGMVLLNKPRNFDPVGAYYEGVSYARFALTEYMMFAFARANSSPSRLPTKGLPSVLEGVVPYFAHTLYPTSDGFLAVNFGDSRLNTDATDAVSLLAASGYSPHLARWYLDRIKSPLSGSLTLLCQRELNVVPRNDLQKSMIYPGIGWAIMRDSWDNDSTLLAVKCGDSWNHAHADAGSFVLFHAGSPLLIDSGTCSYDRPEYRDYYRDSHAHNVVLFNGHGQPEEDVHERGAKFPGRIHSLIDCLGLKYVYADATGPMSPHLRRNYRHWLWTDGVIVVFDDLLAHEPGRFDWLLHYDGEAKRQGSQIEVTNGRARTTVKMLYPRKHVVREERGLVDGRPDAARPYLALANEVPSIVQKFIVAIVPQPVDATAPLPEVEFVESPGVLGVRVQSKSRITDIHFNLHSDGRRMHRNSIVSIAGWETDAYMLAFTRPSEEAAMATPQNVTRYFVGAGSFLRYDGQVVLDSLTKLTAVFQPGKEMKVQLNGQPLNDVRLWSASPVSSLRINGGTHPFINQPDTRTIRFNYRTAELDESN